MYVSTCIIQLNNHTKFCSPPYTLSALETFVIFVLTLKQQKHFLKFEKAQGQSHPQPWWVTPLCRSKISKMELCTGGVIWERDKSNVTLRKSEVWGAELPVLCKFYAWLKMYKHRKWANPRSALSLGWFMAIFDHVQRELKMGRSHYSNSSTWSISNMEWICLVASITQMKEKYFFLL